MSGEKTEAPTAKKKEDLRRKGVVAKSQELPAGVGLLVLAGLVPLTLGRVWAQLGANMHEALSEAGTMNQRGATQLLGRALSNGFASLAPLLLLAAGASVLASVLVARQRPSLASLRPRKEKMSPKAHLRSLLSAQTAQQLVRQVVKLSLVVAVGWSAFVSGYRSLQTGGLGVNGFVSLESAAVQSLIVRVATLAIVVGVIDAALARKKYQKQAKMSKQELKDESKSSEGSPEVKQAIRSRQLRLARTRMIEEVAKADVVLANPTHLVVVLRYTPGTSAPVVVAKGAGAVADRIKAEAAKHQVPIIANKPLARALYRSVKLGGIIPAELFGAVAEVLATVYAMKRAA